MRKRVVVLQANEGQALECFNNLSPAFDVSLYTDDVEKAINFIINEKPDFLILSLMLRSSDGISVIKRVKEISAETVCIVLSALNKE